MNIEETVAELKSLAPATGDWGLVLYTDGGFREKTDVNSWGLHGYFYDYVDRKSGYGLKKCGPTNTGYVGPGIRVVTDEGKILRRSVKNNLEVKSVRIAAYIDGYEPSTGGTNNTAEVTGLLNALKLIEELSPPQTQLVLDSEYAIKGTLLWNAKWKEQNYIKKDGTVRENKELWLEIDAIMKRINEKKIRIAWDWVKGHMDDVGNNSADLISNQAMNAAINGHREVVFTVSPIAKYWTPSVNIHPLLKEPRLYLPINLEQRPIKDGAVYFFGNVGPADDVEGQPSADRGYSVIKVNEKCPVLDVVDEYFMNKCLTNRDIFLVRLRNDMITKAKVYNEILTHGSKFFEPRPDKQVITGVHTRSSTKGFGEAIDPPDTSFRLLENLLGLEALLGDYLENKSEKFGRDEITDSFYTVELKKTKEVPKYIPCNKAFIRADINFDHEGEKYSKPIPLTFGIDMPSQATLRAVVNLNPKLYVIHWLDKNNLMRRFATVLETDAGIGLWCGIYSNKTFMVNLR